MRQLVASGLVETRAHRGAVVARPSLERLTGMFEAMAELEALCAGLAAERMSAAERHELEAIHEELRVLSHAGNPDRFHEVNERFHNAIYAGSQNGYIAEMTLATRVRVQPFRRAQFRNLGRLAKSHAEHDRVVVADHARRQARAPPPRCARISSWCAGSTRSTRCRCKAVKRGPVEAGPKPQERSCPRIRSRQLRLWLGHAALLARTATMDSRRRVLRHKRPPATKRRDIARVAQHLRLDQKSLHAAAVRQAERCRSRAARESRRRSCRRRTPTAPRSPARSTRPAGFDAQHARASAAWSSSAKSL